jgi:hypothetical protein
MQIQELSPLLLEGKSLVPKGERGVENLTMGFFFVIILSLITSNQECKIILDIYISRAFYQYKERLKTKLHFLP